MVLSRLLEDKWKKENFSQTSGGRRVTEGGEIESETGDACRHLFKQKNRLNASQPANVEYNAVRFDRIVLHCNMPSEAN